MKVVISIVLFSISFVLATAQTSNDNYDAALAHKLGADEYGMKSYVMVLLKTGTNITENKVKRDSCFAGHMSNMSVMEEAGQQIIAGPMGENGEDIRGIFILDVPTIEEARAILDADPAINEKYLEPVLMEWYGSAALPTYLPISEKIWKTGF